MRRFQKWWTTLGLIALTPGVTLAAGPFSFGKKAPAQSVPVQKVSAERQAPVVRGQAPQQNQQIAKDVGKALHKAGLAGTDIGLRVKDGVCILEGAVGNLQQKAIATKAAAGVLGVDRVENRLVVTDGPPIPPGFDPAAGVEAYSPAEAQRIQQMAFFQDQGAAAGAPQAAPQVGGPMAPGAGMPGGAPMPGAGGPPPYVPSSVPAPPGYGISGSQSPAMYNQPNMPNYAWPSYSQFPNYASVTYPKQYSASAWPYIGPFYPYPQVPLGWRAAQLEWDDGYWQLNFRPRTERWWWFMDYRNW